MNRSAATRDRAHAMFAGHFGGAPTVTVRAPGRINIIGEHTDYNDGFVLPVAIDRQVWIALAPSDDGAVTLVSEAFADPVRFDLTTCPDKIGGWGAYPQGVGWALAESGLQLAGWRGAVASDLPVGAGLASSAALELAVARAFHAVAELPWDPMPVARLCQRAENGWVGVDSGIMDHLTSAAGVRHSALLIDCRSLQIEPVPLPSGLALVVLDTSTRRDLSSSGYNDRRRECTAAATALGVTTLRDTTTEQLAVSGLDDVLLRRARHVVTENDRTLAAATALREGDAPGLGALLAASHASLRDDFDVSGPALNAIVEAAAGLQGCFGARMTGAGFAGCALAVVAADAVASFCADLRQRFADRTGLRASTHVCAAVEGAGVAVPG